MITTPFPIGLPSGAAASQAEPGVSEHLTPHLIAPACPEPAHVLELWPGMLLASFLSFQNPPAPPALEMFAHSRLLLTRYFWNSLLYARP